VSDPTAVLADELAACRLRGIERLDVRSGTQRPLRVPTLEGLAAQYAASKRSSLNGRVPRIRNLLRDAITAYRREDEINATLISALFFGDSSGRVTKSAGELLDIAERESGYTSTIRFRQARRTALNSFAEFLQLFVADIDTGASEGNGSESSTQERDPENLLLRIYIPSDRLYAAEAGRLLSLFRDWITKTKGFRIRQASSRTTAGEKFEFFAVDSQVIRPDLQEEFSNFGDFLTLCSVNPSAAAGQLIPLGLPRSAATEIVDRFGTEVRRLQVDLRQEREKRIMTIRHDLERQIVDSGIALQSVPSRQMQDLIEHLVPAPTAPESLALMAAQEIPGSPRALTFQINQQFIHAVESQVIQNVQGAVHVGSGARQLIELIAQFGGSEKTNLEASVLELEDVDSTRAERKSAKRRLQKFVSQLVGITHEVAVDLLEKYLESKGL
jgi:hypothetical protein